MAFAKGKKAYGFCDRCAQRWPLRSLKEEVVDEHLSGIWVCPDCYDPDHPQLYMVKRIRTDDAIGLRDPLPDVDLDIQRSFFGFNPVNTKRLRVEVGIVRVTTT